MYLAPFRLSIGLLFNEVSVFVPLLRDILFKRLYILTHSNLLGPCGLTNAVFSQRLFYDVKLLVVEDIHARFFEIS